MLLKELDYIYMVFLQGKKPEKNARGDIRRMAKAGYKKRAAKEERAAQVKKNYRQNFWGMVGITVAVCLLLVVISVMSINLRRKIETNNAVIASLEEEIAAEEDRTAEIEKLKEYMSSDEYVEKIAHEKIGLVYDNETVFKEN